MPNTGVDMQMMLEPVGHGSYILSNNGVDMQVMPLAERVQAVDYIREWPYRKDWAGVEPYMPRFYTVLSAQYKERLWGPNKTIWGFNEIDWGCGDGSRADAYAQPFVALTSCIHREDYSSIIQTMDDDPELFMYVLFAINNVFECACIIQQCTFGISEYARTNSSYYDHYVNSAFDASTFIDLCREYRSVLSLHKLVELAGLFKFGYCVEMGVFPLKHVVQATSDWDDADCALFNVMVAGTWLYGRKALTDEIDEDDWKHTVDRVRRLRGNDVPLQVVFENALMGDYLSG
jgi:hypothetical protein